EVGVRYRQSARFDDPLRVRCWVRDLASRRVEFGYVVEHEDDGRLLVTAATALMALDAAMRPTRLPGAVRQVLRAIPDPVPLQLPGRSRMSSGVDA
ncbi:MAG TPA: thioesterase family protein, partial [Gemmatimonadales bacterium]|nr:thioesterase family protein [Gemmatimonadales bacterium]